MTGSEMSEGNAGSVPRELRWCVGKFVYARGASKPLHFMELKSFIIEDATDYSHLFYLRGLRSRQEAGGVTDDDLKRWMDGTAVKPLGELVAHVLESLETTRHAIIEYFPGVGLTAEYAKLVLQRNASSQASRRIERYEGRGPAKFANQFLVLQADEDVDVQYCPDLLSPVDDEGAVTIVNMNQSVRYEDECEASLEALLRPGIGPKILAMRVTSGDQDVWHMTVKGRAIKLPSLKSIRDLCGKFGRHWNFRFLDRFDAGYFLPTPGPSTGLLLAYDAGREWPLAGYSKFE
ncbi:hypothetical protein ACQR1I_35620 [Bradyrhizobium sp. HKCCYLS2038]|uniref:hypothetical protein n=1 Tax=unclassified Bradyrhizobium TaxID=2631580 RepID=UPI003EB7378E